MKKTKILLIAFSAFSILGYAQRYEGAKNFNLSVGGLKNGTELTVGFEKLRGENGSLNVELSWLNKKEELRVNKDVDVKLASFLLDAKYKYYVYPMNSFFPYVSLGLFGGYESIKNKSDIPASVLMDRENSFVYGVSPQIGIEYNIQKISLELYVRPRYELKYSEFITSGGLTVKYYF